MKPHRLMVNYGQGLPEVLIQLQTSIDGLRSRDVELGQTLIQPVVTVNNFSGQNTVTYFAIQWIMFNSEADLIEWDRTVEAAAKQFHPPIQGTGMKPVS